MNLFRFNIILLSLWLTGCIEGDQPPAAVESTPLQELTEQPAPVPIELAQAVESATSTEAPEAVEQAQPIKPPVIAEPVSAPKPTIDSAPIDLSLPDEWLQQPQQEALPDDPQRPPLLPQMVFDKQQPQRDVGITGRLYGTDEPTKPLLESVQGAEMTIEIKR